VGSESSVMFVAFLVDDLMYIMICLYWRVFVEIILMMYLLFQEPHP
jgi:hypothetical protein